MSDFTLIIIFLALAFGALLIVSAINAQQTRKKLINQKLHQLKRKVAEYEEMTASLEILTGNIQVIRAIIEETVDILQGMLQLSPNTSSIELSLDTALARLEEINAPTYHCNVHRLLESDAAIAHGQHLLNEAGRVIRKRQAQGHIELAQMNGLIEELAWAHLMISVISLTGQGHKAIQRGDIMRAHAFYKKAQEAAMESVIKDDRRHKWIKELSELMSGSKRSISVELMPETMYNPDTAVS